MLSTEEVLELYEGDSNPFLSWVGTVLVALDKGYSVSVNDGEEWVVNRSRNFQEIKWAVDSVDECTLGIWVRGELDHRPVANVDGQSWSNVGYCYVHHYDGLEGSVYDSTANEWIDDICKNPNYKVRDYA